MHQSKTARAFPAGPGRHQLINAKGRNNIRSYSDTTSTSSSDEGYGYYEINKSGNRHGRKYATLAASSVSRRRARSRNDRFYEAQRSLWSKGENSSNDSYEKTRGSKNTDKDINKLTAAAFSEALKKHFSSVGSRQQQEHSQDMKGHGVDGGKICTDNIGETFYIDPRFSAITGKSDNSAVNAHKKLRKEKRKQKYH